MTNKFVGGPGQDHGDDTEDRPELHDPVMAQAVGEEPERRGQDELGHEERRERSPLVTGLDRCPAVLGELGEVVDEERTGQARAESERERAEEDGPQGTPHDLLSVPARIRRKPHVRPGVARPFKTGAE